MKDTLVALNESDGKVTADVAVADTGNIFSQYLNPTKEKDVLGDSEVTGKNHVRVFKELFFKILIYVF